mgnify:CR=1 FL=1
MSDLDDLDALANELEEFSPPEKKGGRSAREERIIAGFEDIQRFVDEHGRVPQHGDSRDIFERLYAVRLDRLKAQQDCRLILEPLDHQGLLAGPIATEFDAADMDEDTLAAELAGMVGDSDITTLTHVRSAEDIRAEAEMIASREKCRDFDQFKALFDEVKKDLEAGSRQSIRFEKSTDINQGEFFILDGHTVYVADKETPYQNSDGHWDARLRAIFSNGTESNLLMRSLQKALYKDEAGRRVLSFDPGPLFRDSLEDGDLESGTIYVLRSLSDHPFISEHRSIIHKIGVTGSDIKTRLANAAMDPTFLLANVEVVATYKLAGIDRVKMEKILHRIFSRAQLDLAIKDRFGNPVKPREWFMLPLKVINEAIERIRDGSITEMVYDPEHAKLIRDKK